LTAASDAFSAGSRSARGRSLHRGGHRQPPRERIEEVDRQRSGLRPSQYKVVPLIATTGSMGELLRQIFLELGSPEMSTSSAKLFKAIRDQLQSICQKKLTPEIIVDEAYLIRT